MYSFILGVRVLRGKKDLKLQDATSNLALCIGFFFGLAAWLVLLSHAAFPFDGYRRPFSLLPSSTDCGFDNHISKCRPPDRQSASPLA